MTGQQELQRCELAEAGIEYCQESLRGLCSLATELIPRVADRGTSFTLLPTTRPAGSEFEFETGGKFATFPMGGRHKLLPDMPQRLAEWLKESSMRDDVCILHHASASPEDPYLRDESNLVFAGQEVYSVLEISSIPRHELEYRIRFSRALFSFFGFTSRRDSESASAGIPPSEVLVDLARTATSLFVQAYDGESFVVVPLES